MNTFVFNFLLGLICTLFLLVISVIIVLGIKALGFFSTGFTKKPQVNQPKPKKHAPKKPKPLKHASNIVRSIEIDPEQIDKIYVKKTG